MADDGVQVSESSSGKWILLALAALYVAGSLYFIFDLRGRLEKVSKDQATSSVQMADLGKRMQSAEADDETLAQQVGLTKKEMATRSAELMRQQRASEARLAEAQKQQISAVSGEVAGVKSVPISFDASDGNRSVQVGDALTMRVEGSPGWTE